MRGRDDIKVGVLGGGADDGVVVGSGGGAAVQPGDPVWSRWESPGDYPAQITCTSTCGRPGGGEIELLVTVDGIDSPTYAQFDSVGDVDFDDECFDEYLGARDIEFLNDSHQGLIGFLARLDDQGVGGGIRAEGDSLGEGRDLGAKVLNLSAGGAGSARGLGRATLARKHAG